MEPALTNSAGCNNGSFATSRRMNAWDQHSRSIVLLTQHIARRSCRTLSYACSCSFIILGRLAPLRHRARAAAIPKRDKCTARPKTAREPPSLPYDIEGTWVKELPRSSGTLSPNLVSMAAVNWHTGYIYRQAGIIAGPHSC